MSNVSEGEIKKAEEEHFEAIKNYERIHSKYFPVGPVTPGVPTALGAPVKNSTFVELQEAMAKITETWDKFERLWRASRS